MFLCSRNRLRSPTAERVFADWPGVETDSAGLADDAEVPLSADQLEGCDLVCVMERAHLRRLKQRFAAHLRGMRVVCLDIPDDYAYMDPALVALLERKVAPLLRGLTGR
ncbi:low molecular weight protein tyrosine phosphatase family protein [Stenotrophomonas panacihumi]|uniref:low molecular weight protein tyrosine phosphatase family protein n=1 Tax=Stenotrophomonas panacihumi TaxID=676599 RepID=UPI00192A10E2|nr:low molecular weight protein tyrosine phosphatase family protein [Stenotrophomonas panacihumi]